MIFRCKICGGPVELKPDETVGICRDCGTKQEIEKSVIYTEAETLALQDTEESLEQAILLYRSIPGWQDANKRYIDCRTRLGQMRWKVESAWLKEEEARFEAKVARWKKIGITALVLLLLCIATVSTVTLYRFWRYNKAAELFTAGEYERAAAAFQAIANYQDSRTRVFLSAVELYKAKRYQEALPYFAWLDGYIDNGYYLEKCQERLGIKESSLTGIWYMTEGEASVG
jgi:hypothetical protein